MARWKLLRVLSVLLISSVSNLCRTPGAFGFMLGLDGQVEMPSALYANTSDGGLKKIIGRGDRAPDGGMISDIGTPAVSPEGILIFGAEVCGRRREWQIFRADPNARDVRIEPALDEAAISAECRPMLVDDPHVIAGPDSSIVFVAKDQRGRGTLFRYADGRLSCEVRSGDRTAQGHVIANLGFGSEQAGEHGTVVLQAAVATNSAQARRHDTKRAILLVVSGRSPSEVAVENGHSVNGSRYGKHFGLPAIAESDGKPLVAFTNYGAKGAALFVGTPGHLHAEIGTESQTGLGSLCYLSEQRPSLNGDGSIVIQAASGDRSFIVEIRAGEPFIIAREGDEVAKGQKTIGLGTPVRSASGLLYDEVVAEDETGRLCSFSAAGPPTVLSGTLDAFPSSLAVNRNDRFAFLARDVDKHTANFRDAAE